MPTVPPCETRTVNGRHYVAGEEYPEQIDTVEVDKARIEKPKKGDKK